MTSRTVSRQQTAEYAEGSNAKGYFRYSVQGLERCGARLSYFDLLGEQKPSRKEAIESAWQAAREWVAEIGPVSKTDREYSSV